MRLIPALRTALVAVAVFVAPNVASVSAAARTDSVPTSAKARVARSLDGPILGVKRMLGMHTTPTVDVESANPGADIERSACVTVAIRPGAAYECGDLRLASNLPAIRVFNQTRTATLLYNSQHARPTPIVRAWVTRQADSWQPNYVRAKLWVNGVQRDSNSWLATGWAAGERRQVALSFDATNLSTNLYKYTLEIVFDYGDRVETITRIGELAIVNRSTSEFGPGWWVAGYESIKSVPNPAQTDDMYWVGGDGSTRKYVFQYEAANAWWIYYARTLTGVDSLIYTRDGFWRRPLSHGAYVRFNASGRHDHTFDALGRATIFATYYGCNRLGAIQLALPAGQPDWKGWSFNYDADNNANPCVGQARHNGSAATNSGGSGIWRWTWRTIQANGGSIQHEPSGAVTSYTEANGRIASWTDVRGTRTNFHYVPGGLLSSAHTPTGTPGDSVKQIFYAGEGAALVGPKLQVDVFTGIYNPRFSPAQPFTKLWLGPWGNPLVVTDAVGRTTSVLPHATFPLLAARVTAPSGYSHYALYNAHGKLTYLNADAVNGQTPEWYYRYTDAAHPDNLMSTTDPAGITTTYTYNGPVFNTYPSLSDVENPANAATRVSVTYCQVARCLGLPSATLSAQNAQGVRSKDSLDYDALGNLTLTLSAGGKRTETTNDGIGRVLSTRTLVATTPSVRWVTTDMSYDALDRVTATTTTAPGDGVTGQQQLETRTQYVGASALVASVRRWSVPDQLVGVLRDSSTYDAVGRVLRHFAQGATSDPTKAEAFVYDAASNVTQRVTARGDTIRMEYDALNRVTRRLTPAVVYDSLRFGTATYAPGDPERSPVFPQFALGTATYLEIESEEATFSYDPLSGQLARAANREAIVERKYDPIGRLIADTQTVRTLAGVLDTTHRYGLRYEYDIAGRFTRLFHPAQLAPGSGSETHTYTTDTGLPWRVFDPVGGFIIFTFDPKGQLVTQASPSGISRGFRYAADGEPIVDSVRNQAVGARYPLPNPTGLARYATLTYDVRGKLLRMQNTYGRREDLISTYSPMGMVRASRFSTYGIGATGNAVTFTGVDTTLSDALGNRIGGSTALSQSVSSGPGSGFPNPGGGGGNVQWSSLNFTYDPSGNGWLLNSTVGTGGTSQLVYDQAGNTLQQTTAGRAATDATPGVEPSERIMYYDALGQLRAVDSRIGPTPGEQTDLQGSAVYRLTFDTYHYDALGRRVLARSQRTCPFGSPYFVWCALGNVRRTVWSGSRELYEIQMPDSSQWRENDTATVTIGIAAQGSNLTAQFDISPFFGRVGYVHGEGTIDQPLAVLRVNYRDNPIKPNTTVRWGFRTFQPFALYPLWDLRAEPALGSTLDGGLWPCETTAQSETRCTYPMAWTGLWSANGVTNPGQLKAWNGSLLEDKREGNGLSFRRNRYLDPANGRFTQPDPIGLAGGLNSYGFAGGDPVNFADPFGLCPEGQVEVRGKCVQLVTGNPLFASSAGASAGIARAAAGVATGVRTARLISAARGILNASEFATLRAAAASGVSAEVSIAGRTIIYEPGLTTASGMTLFGENGFVLGRQAFSSGAETVKTVLHELYRLSTSTTSSTGASAAAAAAETAATKRFADAAYAIGRSLSIW